MALEIDKLNPCIDYISRMIGGLMTNNLLILDFNLCETTIRITSENHGVQEMVNNYFYPYVSKSLSAGVEPEVLITIDFNQELFRKYQDEFNERINEWVISLCRTEKGTYRLYEYEYLTGARLLKAQKTDFILIESENTYRVIVKPDYLVNGKPNDDLYHLFEHVISKKAATKGYILLHASSVAIKDKAILFIGKKRTGKTTTFFEACIQNGAVPISVDKTYVKASKSGLIMACHPSPLRVLAGTLKKYGDNFIDLIPEKYRNASSEVLWKGEGDGKVRMGLNYLEDFIGRKAVTSAPVGCLIFPYIHFDRPNKLTHITNPDIIADHIKDNLFSPNNPEEDWWSRIGIDENTKIGEMTAEIVIKLSNTHSYMLESADAISSLISEAAAEVC